MNFTDLVKEPDFGFIDFLYWFSVFKSVDFHSFLFIFSSACGVCVRVCVCVCDQSYPTLCDPWTLAHQAPLTMRFPRQEYWSWLPFPSPGHLPNPGTEPASLVSPALAGRFFCTSAFWEPLLLLTLGLNCSSFSSFLRWKLSWLILDLSSFLIYWKL